PVRSAADVYDAVRTRPAGTSIEYTFRNPDGQTLTGVVASRVFSQTDYVLLFGAFLLTAAAFLATGFLVVWLKPENPASYGLLASGLVTGTFLATAVDLYGPHWFVRIHVLAESLLAPSFFHLALVFPAERLPRHRRRVLAFAYIAFAILGGVYEAVLASPSAYTAVHLAASATHAIGAGAIIVAVLWDLLRSRSALVRRRVGV